MIFIYYLDVNWNVKQKNLEREENNQCSRLLSITYNAKKCIVGNQESGKNPDDEFIYFIYLFISFATGDREIPQSLSLPIQGP